MHDREQRKAINNRKQNQIAHQYLCIRNHQLNMLLIYFSSSTGPTNYDDNEDDVVLVDRLGSNDASVLVKDPSRPIIPRPAATRTLRNNNNTKKKKRRKLKVPGRPSTSAKAAKERRRRKKKKMRSWPSSARKDDALSLRHEPVFVSVVDEDADDNDNDNNLTKITNGTYVIRDLSIHRWRVFHCSIVLYPSPRKTKRTNPNNRKGKLISQISCVALFTFPFKCESTQKTLLLFLQEDTQQLT